MANKKLQQNGNDDLHKKFRSREKIKQNLPQICGWKTKIYNITLGAQSFQFVFKFFHGLKGEMLH